MRIKNLNKWLLFVIISFFILIAILFSSLYYNIKNPHNVSTLIFSSNQNLIRITLAPDDMWRIPIKEKEISPALKKAVLAYEDKHFYFHFGVNPVSVIRALAANIQAGKVVQGASTITMQVARLSNPKPRTIKNKLIEIFRAWQLELKYSKNEI
ncbi:hypothetical protein B6I21_03280, partial [candidate division KSB1 bacterium 4572_119]